jgi:hypothetical protein
VDKFLESEGEDLQEGGPSPQKMHQEGGPSPKKTVQKGHDLDLDLDLDLKKNGGGFKAISSREEKPPDEEKEPPPPPEILEKIKNAAQTAGYFIGDDIAIKLAKRIPFNDWVEGPFNFLELMAKRVKKYPDENRRNVFIKAVSWDNLYGEYPDWRKAQENAEKSAQSKAARENKPAFCSCGYALAVTGKCPNCGKILSWDSAREKYFFSPSAKTAGMSSFFRDKISAK